MNESMPARDLARTTFGVLFLGGLLVSSFWILRPFLAPFTWATMLTISSWPLLIRMQEWFGGRRGWAIAAMMTLQALTIFVPLVLIFDVLVQSAPGVAAWVRNLLHEGLPTPPTWVDSVPLVGPTLAESWAELAAAGPQGLSARISPHTEELAGWVATQIGGAGRLMLHFLITLLLTGFLFARGEQVGTGVRQFARRLAGDRGDRAAVLAAQSVRAVAVGVVVTALIQAAVGGLGLVISGVPVPGLLTAVMFVASIAQVGAAPVLALATVWLFVQGDNGWGVAMVVWTAAVGSLDNVIRPLLIRKGVDLPLMLVFAGVIGGLIAFGPIGLFAGPVVLAVAHTLLLAWIHDGDAARAAGAADWTAEQGPLG